MKKKATRVSVLVTMILLILLSCKKDKTNDNAVADVYVKSILSDGEPVFGLAHYVLGYAAMTSVTVSTPVGMTDPLNAYNTGKTIFYIEPSLALGTYTGTPPSPGTYSYGITFNDGIEKVITDDLGATYILPASITSIVKSSNNQSVIMSWEPLAGAEYFQVSIYKEGTWQWTSSAFPPPTGNTTSIPLSVIPSYSPGSYTYQLDAVNYASAETGNFQAISSASVTIDL
jgi:hypothetical protein